MCWNFPIFVPSKASGKKRGNERERDEEAEKKRGKRGKVAGVKNVIKLIHEEVMSIYITLLQ